MGVPRGVADGWMEVGVGVWGCPMHACMHTHAHARTHACTCMLNMINMDASMLAAICNFYTCIHMHACVCMHAHTCACMWGHPMPPDAPRHPPPTCSLPRATGSPKYQDSLPLNIPELIQTITDHPGHPPATCPAP